MTDYPIYIVDDDLDDNEIIKEVWKELGLPNEIIFFTSGKELITQLQNDNHIPFIIICDVNLPLLDGFDIRERLLADPQTRYKTVPFIFWSNSVSDAQVKRAYDLAAHGMFIKGSSMSELKMTFTRIIEYWQSSLKPK